MHRIIGWLLVGMMGCGSVLAQSPPAPAAAALVDLLYTEAGLHAQLKSRMGVELMFTDDAETADILQRYAPWLELRTALVERYTATYTPAELDALLAFYQTETGQHIAQKHSVLHLDLDVILKPRLQRAQMAMALKMNAQMNEERPAFLAKMEEASAALTQDIQDAMTDVLKDSSMAEYAHDLGSFEAVNRPAPDFEVTDLQGQPMALQDWRGQIVVVNFWESWCGPCKLEMPHFERAYQHFKDDERVVFIAINGGKRDSRKKAREFMADLPYTFPIAYDATGGLLDKFEGPGLPSNFLIDTTGQIRYTVFGYNPALDFTESLTTHIERLLTEMQTP